MIRNISYFSDFEEINEGYVAFGGTPKGSKITGKGKIKTGKLDFDDVYFVKELKFNLFSVSQMCDKNNSVHFIDTECIVLSSDFKLADENHVLLRVPRANNMYNVDLKNIVPSGDLTCRFVKATLDESNLWHRRLGHINFKTINKLVKGNLVRGLPSKVFENNHTYVACKKGKQHRASWSDPTWLFDIDTLTQYMNYQLVIARNQPNSSAGIQETLNVGTVKKEAKFVQQYVLLPIWSFGSKDPQNTDAATFEVKGPESEVYVSPSSCDQTKKPDDKTTREAKGKNHVNTSVTAVRPNLTNSTNAFSAAGPFNNVVSLNFKLGGKSSYVDPSQYPDDPDMPALEDITYSDDEEDVGAKADFSNLETNITGHTQEEGIDYEEAFAPVARIESLCFLYGLYAIIMALTFADTHNMIAFLTKSDASEGFEQIIDFLNAHKSNDVVRLQALIDRKKVIITEDSIRQALRLDDADSVDCLPNEEIFVELARMGYKKPSTKLTFYKAFFLAQWKFLIHKILQCMSAKRTAWNEFSSSMASAVICLATGVDTLLFAGMLMPQQAQEVEDAAEDEDDVNERSQSSSKGSRGGKTVELDADEDVTLEEVTAEETKDADVQGRLEESQAKVYHLDLEHADKVLSMQETNEAESAELMTEVVTTVATNITAAIPITATPVPEASAPRRRRGVILQDPKEAATTSEIMNQRQAQIEQDEAFARELKAELNANINWNEVVEQVKRKERQDNTVMRYQSLKRKPVTEAQARKNMMVYLKNMSGFKMDFFKGMTYTEIRPIFEKHFNSIWAFLEKGEKEIEEEESKRKRENLEQKVAKKQKIDEETEQLKTHLQIVPNDEDDVYTKATPLALKIIRADGTHQLFLSFITLLRNFDREDLEMLWKLVQERFQSLKPKNFSDDFLLNTLKTMFEKSNVKANIWRNQRGIYRLAKVKS
nr:putative ribonuclease H-like domain-containing protein [Tanacetum cinerariifolium]